MKRPTAIPIRKLQKAYACIGFLLCLGFGLNAQNQKLNDSLEIVYNKGQYEKKDELGLLKELARSEANADKILTYSLLLITKAKEQDSTDYEFEGYLQQGNGYRLKSELTRALESYFNAARVASEHGLRSKEASINIAIADVYSIMGDGKVAMGYYKKALALLDPQTDALTVASAQLNLGDEYLNQKQLDSALYFFRESGRTFKAENYEMGEAYNLGNVGLVYAEMGKHREAEENLNQAVDILTGLGDYYPICVYLTAMADIYDAQNQEEKSLKYALRSLELAKQHGLKEQISDSNLKLSEFYESQGNSKKALDYYKEHIVFRDQVSSIQDVQRMANIRTEYEVSQKQMEVDLLNQQKKVQRYVVIGTGITLLLIGLLAFSLFKRNRFMKRTNELIAYEKQRSDDLLKNILPAETAEELKENGAVKAKQFEQVTVLFTDFKSFTKQSENLDPEHLVKSIDYYFSKFDEIIDEYGLEKIKTIGDSYMCACGLPFPIEDHALRTCQAALDIVEFVRKTKRNSRHELAKFDVRVGIHTGTVVAGVVGTKKFQYDIWGDTVNTASRMESSSEVGRVNISETTYQLLKEQDEFTFSPRGFLEVKGKGKVAMYYVEYTV